MKKARAVLTGVVVCVLVVFSMHGQMAGPLGQPVGADNLAASGSNVFWLQLTGITNNAASLVVYVPGTTTNSIMNLFFTTNPETPSGWSRVMRLEPGQTNPIVTNLPAPQGFFMLSSPIRPGFDQQNLPANDDGSTASVPLPFTINFLNNSESALYINNNGNVTFDKPLSTYSPINLASAGVKIVAPFWADVDTRNPASGVVTYGTNVVQGYNAFGADWVNVGYYDSHADELLSCQLVIIDRSDIAPGDFDMEFNYDRVEWQWGDVSVGYPPRVGFSDGTMDYELPGSGTNGAFMDTNMVTGLVYNSLKTPVLGRYLFLFRNGQPLP
ncbi:MAG TPA: nidogen-like domain-containing protein [Verrucomicrobiae bacterium]|nr:nidogen-like domain-containing protein [Verrucomicrobiae bacterium]